MNKKSVFINNKYCFMYVYCMEILNNNTKLLQPAIKNCFSCSHFTRSILFDECSESNISEADFHNYLVNMDNGLSNNCKGYKYKPFSSLDVRLFRCSCFDINIYKMENGELREMILAMDMQSSLLVGIFGSTNKRMCVNNIIKKAGNMFCVKKVKNVDCEGIEINYKLDYKFTIIAYDLMKISKEIIENWLFLNKTHKEGYEIAKVIRENNKKIFKNLQKFNSNQSDLQ